VQDQLVSFIRAADEELDKHRYDHSRKNASTSLVDYHSPTSLQTLLPLDLPTTGFGPAGFLSALRPILAYSVNTFSPGFLDKLYSGTNAPGIAADLILSVLNTNVHVYQVSPVLTLVEKHTTKALASLFGLAGPRAGGISVQGGSASNMASIVIARNTLYPASKIYGNAHDGRQLVLFTSAHGHYSIEKAAQACGFGSAAVVPVPVDPVTGAMLPTALESLIVTAKNRGMTPFYVNATAGTTALGSFDPFCEIAAIARRYGMWFHIDASWGGPFIFSSTLKHKLRGAELADSIATNPHKMMGVPITCSFLLAKDLRQFHRANTLPAGYLFHSNEDSDAPNGAGGPMDHQAEAAESGDEEDGAWNEPDDLADLTLQCGRRGDSLKLFLSWQYYGSAGYAAQVENAYTTATYLADLVEAHPDMILVSEHPPPCLQVCFYFAPGGRMVFANGENQAMVPISSVRGGSEAAHAKATGRWNSMVTERITKALVVRGFMIDFAPALEGRGAEGKFFRVVVNGQTARETVHRLVEEIAEVGMQVRDRLRQECEDGWGGDVRNGIGGTGGLVERKKKAAEKGHGTVVRQCHS
jgi:glutamate/tyrosine decarboxylase-like PLP-dependent enzyme